MNQANSSNQVFITKLTEIILSNLEKENFGVNELAHAAGMTSSSLRRKLSAVSDKSINQLIREVRLQRAMEMLQQEDVTASEVAYKVGFGSPAYFNKCFHEYFGYPPGEVKKREIDDLEENSSVIVNNVVEEEEKPAHKKPSKKIIFYTAGSFLILFSIYLLFNNLSFESFSILPGDKLKPEEKSIAVQTFINLSGDEENQYFAEGVTGSILYNLIQISEIKVINSPITDLEENALNLKKMAGKLGFRFFLTGSVQKTGEQVLVMARLTDITTNQIIWSDKYPRKLSDIFMIQSDIAQQVSINLQTVITQREKEQIEKVPTQNVEAHAYYVMGRFFWNRRTEDGVKKSIEYFEKAVQSDPDYALAWIGLADGYNILAGYGWYIPKKEGYDKAIIYVQKALKLDKTLAEAHTTFGLILGYQQWKWEEAEKKLKLALKLNPNYAFAHQIYAQLLDITGDYEKARKQIDLALELDPLAPVIHRISATLFYNAENFDESLKEYNEVLSVEKNYESAHWGTFLNYYRLGDGDRAIEKLQEILQLYKLTLTFGNVADSVYVNSGLRGLIEWIIDITPTQPKLKRAIDLAVFHAILGNNEEALKCLENYLENSPGDALVRLINQLDYESLRSEPRFIVVVDKLGLTEYYEMRLKQPGYIKSQ